MRRYDSFLGFNSTILTGIARKAKSLEELKRHSGLIVDEMKLFECINFGAGRILNGLVDLRKITPESYKHVPCDHGLLIVLYIAVGECEEGAHIAITEKHLH
ncbi:hypothetical protein HPB48_010466 [Haemaphysalis longicornis]|uniref:Uncharacterized protein n=1 Tax=Haemaphysalis longicornis TaxID=44386 RepID=A0A9J6FN51_HAELO|nr:hypothetical protein HPB48_010466 [Haemaphysalis longicornis]